MPGRESESSGIFPGHPKPESYSGSSPFVRLLRTESRVRMLDVLLGKHYEELRASEIAELANIDPTTVNRNIDALVAGGLVDKYEAEDGAVYRINHENEAAEAFATARTRLFDHSKTLSSHGEESTLSPPDSEKEYTYTFPEVENNDVSVTIRSIETQRSSERDDSDAPGIDDVRDRDSTVTI